MTLIVNKRYGGFGLSDEAKEMYLDLKGIKYKISREDHIWGKEYVYKDSGEPINFHSIPRNDPDLILVVKKLKDKANNRWSKLELVDIPDSFEDNWEIIEYDGLETVVRKDYIIEKPHNQ